MNLKTPKILAALALLAPAAVGHDRGCFPFDPYRVPREMGRFMGFGETRVALPRVRVEVPRVEFGVGGRPIAVYEHCWRYVDEREWVAPVFEDVVVGYDRCGRPLLERALVQRGYWTVVRYRICDCGVRVRC